MTDREKIISRLQIIRTWASVGPSIEGRCLEDIVRWLDDALALLKAQEPRVMTWEEASELEHDTVVWYEFNGVNGPRPRVVHYTNNLCVTFTDGGTWRFEVDGYGKRFRLWTSRPDEKRRAETPWQQ